MTELTAVEPQEMLATPPDISHLVTEDDTPVDNIFSEKQMRLLAESLHSSWSGPGDGRPFVTMANVGLFYALHEPPLVPDVLLSVDVHYPEEPWRKEHRSYFVWEYGKAPDLVIEIVSNRKGGELGDKLMDYARAGVGYYIVFDPDRELGDQPLRVFARRVNRFTEVGDAWLPEIGLGLRLWEGDYEDMHAVWLRWHDRSGALIATGAEAKRTAEERAAQAEQRAEEAEQRAEEERRRAAAMAERLRALGIDPDSGEMLP